MNGKLKPFERAVHVPPSLAKFIEEAASFGVPPHEAQQSYDYVLTSEVWVNDEYQVAIDKNPHHGFDGMTVWHLSIKRLSRKPLHDWRDLQAIKSMLCGENVEAIELYPATSRVVDTSNQYHLWAFMAYFDEQSPQLPIGWSKGMTINADNPDGSYNGSAAKQRPL